MPSMKHRHYSSQFRAKVALEALKGQHTLSELASRYGVHPSQITRWKQQLEAGVHTFTKMARQQQVNGNLL